MIGLDTCFLIDLYWKDSPRHQNARALYEKTKVDFEIPFEFYREVAEILNFVYELKHIKPPVPKKGNKY